MVSFLLSKHQLNRKNKKMNTQRVLIVCTSSCRGNEGMEDLESSGRFLALSDLRAVQPALPGCALKPMEAS